MSIKKRKITEYQQDKQNANKGNTRGQKMIDSSFAESGAGRSVLVTADDVLIAGNHAIEGAMRAGITDVIEIETDGSQLVVVKRVDLQAGDKKAKRLAIADNRVGQVNLEFSADQLMQDIDMLEGLFRQDEIDALLVDHTAELETALALDTPNAKEKSRVTKRKYIIKPVLSADEIRVFEKALKATGKINRGEALIDICKQYLDSQV